MGFIGYLCAYTPNRDRKKETRTAEEEYQRKGKEAKERSIN